MINSGFLLPFVLLGTVVFAQNKFELKEASKNYKVKINVEICENYECSGKSTIELFDKRTTKKFQTLTSDNLNFLLNEDQKPTVDIIHSPLVFGDFNFDGKENIAIRNEIDRDGGRSYYDVYIFNTTKKQFVPNVELTHLANENLGMFTIDSERKRLITYSKSICCWGLTTEYTVIPKRGLVKVYEIEEDTTKGNGKVRVTKREFINDEWKTNTMEYPISQYYKN